MARTCERHHKGVEAVLVLAQLHHEQSAQRGVQSASTTHLCIPSAHAQEWEVFRLKSGHSQLVLIKFVENGD